MQWSKDAAAMFFFNLPGSLHLLFLFFYFSSVLLAKFFTSNFIRRTILFQSTNDGHDGHEAILSEEEHDGDGAAFFTFESTDREDLVADVICGGEALSFLHIRSRKNSKIFDEGEESIEEPIFEDPYELFVMEELPFQTSELASQSDEQVMEDEVEKEEDQHHPPVDNTDHYSFTMSNQNVANEVPKLMEPTQIRPEENYTESNNDQAKGDNEEMKNLDTSVHEDSIVKTNISDGGKFVILETKKLIADQKDDVEVIYGDSYTDGSTSNSSSEWRKSSLNYRDSGTDDPFSSSSRRSCPTWESYSMFKKYDEEMIFLDKISAQKLSETESLRAVQVCPKSVSQRIVHKLTPRNKRLSELSRNPYEQLESAYVAQVCLAWEALSWDYKNFKQIRASRCDEDGFCPARIAQQFQQFQVLLQRFIENEPFEHGRRPEVYARMRRSAPKLLQVPEFRDSEEAGEDTVISTDKFLRIMEDCIRTFMNFLKADTEKMHKQIFRTLFKRNHRSTIDPNIIHLLKRTNRKKKRKLEDLCRAQRCLRKRKLKGEEEMEILMSLIDLKLVSRVLRMCEISQQQVQWCEEKMSKVKVWEGKVRRDSSPLSFPAH